jgi:competence protein ComEC
LISAEFKNVGQGDSIILSWIDDQAEPSHAIIDCKLHNKTNPTLEFVKQKKLTKIRFIILSHPHYDHYSGMQELLQYCYDKNIEVGYFLHTCPQVVEYINTALSTFSAKKSLEHVFNLVRCLRDERGTNVGIVEALNGLVKINLFNGVNMVYLSPSSKEYDQFASKENYNGTYNSNGKPYGNFLSTLIKIEGNGWFFLLTSDIERKALIRIDRKSPEELEGELVLAQTPHHGSDGNHTSVFWKNRVKNTKTKVPIIFSVPVADAKHPAKRVFDFFDKHKNYQIYSTNPTSFSGNTGNTGVILGMIGKVKPMGNLHGDLKFEVTTNGTVTKV